MLARDIADDHPVGAFRIFICKRNRDIVTAVQFLADDADLASSGTELVSDGLATYNIFAALLNEPVSEIVMT